MEELQKDSEEFARLLGEATRARVKSQLTSAKAEVDREIMVLEMKLKQKPKSTNQAPQRYYVELVEFAWDQSEKFVKIFVNLEGVQNLDDSALKVTFTEDSVELFVSDWNGKNCGLTVNNLLKPIISEDSYYKIKTGLIAIYLKKKSDGQNWSHLTTVERRLKDKQERDMKSKLDDDNNPNNAVMNILKKMYETGDSKTRQMIAKTWTESQEKIHKEHPDLF